MNMLRLTLVPSAIALSSACSSSSSSDPGSPPAISDVTLDKTTITVGVVETIHVTVAYTDADGDVAKLEEQLAPHGGTSQAPDSVDIPEAAGQKQGTQAIVIQVGAPQKGDADLVFWLVDAKGNESAHVTKTITAQ